MATPYIGNNDYRGYLNYLAQSGDGKAASLLNVAGNDGGLSVSRISNPTTAEENRKATVYNTLNDINDYYYNQWRESNVNDTGSYNAADTQTATREASARKGYDDLISRTNNSINDLASSLQNRLDSIAGEYNTLKNEQQSNYNQQKNSYDNSSRQNMNDLVVNRKNIIDNASAGLRGLLRVLGARGAGGSSAALYDAPNAVKLVADRENANAGQTYAKNQVNLDTSWNNFLIGHENDKKKLEDWRTGQEKAAKQENEQNKINLLNQLSDAYINRAQVGGALDGDYNNITDRINQANQTIRDLGKYTTPQYTGETAVYEAKPLSTYDTGKMNIDTGSNNNAGDGQTLLGILQNINKKKQNNGLEA